jgi:hypothetical protein
MTLRTIDPTSLTWRKSTRSSGSGNACVEVAQTPDGAVAIRDSKHPEGTFLLISPRSWRTLIHGLKR